MTDEELRRVPAPEIVGQVGTEIRGAVDAGVAGAIARVHKLGFKWHLSAMAGAAAVTVALHWWWPVKHANEYVVHHADGLVEICTRAPDSTESRPSFACRYYAPAPAPRSDP